MITIKVDGIKEVQSMFRDLAREQVPFAMSKGINDLAFLIREKEMNATRQVFDRPKPQTVKNFFVRKGNKKSPSAAIWFDQIYERGYEEYMVPQVEGGGRGLKRSEKMLGRYYVPAAGAKLDAYGNMRGSQLVQILSQLKRFGEVGHLMNQTSRSAGRRRGSAKSTEYFMLNQPRGGLKPGVYQRVQSGPGFGGPTSRALPAGAFQKGRSSGKFSSVIRGRGVVPVMLFVKQPVYRKRFPFFDVAQQVIDSNFARVMGDAIAYAIRTAR